MTFLLDEKGVRYFENMVGKMLFLRPPPAGPGSVVDIHDRSNGETNDPKPVFITFHNVPGSSSPAAGAATSDTVVGQGRVHNHYVAFQDPTCSGNNRVGIQTCPSLLQGLDSPTPQWHAPIALRLSNSSVELELLSLPRCLLLHALSQLTDS